MFTAFMTKQQDLGEADLEMILFMSEMLSQKLTDGISLGGINSPLLPVLSRMFHKQSR